MVCGPDRSRRAKEPYKSHGIHMQRHATSRGIFVYNTSVTKWCSFRYSKNFLNVVSLLLVFSARFSVEPFNWQLIKIKIETVHQIKSRIWEKKEGKYAKTLVKIQVTANFRMQDMRKNVLPQFLEICMETPCWCPSRWAPTWRPKPTETSVTKVCYKGVNLSLEGLKKLK